MRTSRRVLLIAGPVLALAAATAAFTRRAKQTLLPSKSWTAEAARAVSEPPRSLSAFTLTATPPSSGPSSTVDFAISCKSCGGQTFALSSFPRTTPAPSPYVGLEPGETLHRPPHRLKCARCDSPGMLFDARTDGYDGHLNGGCAYESGEDGEVFMADTFRTTVSVTYNIALAELEELATEADAATTSDLFDALAITATPTDGGDVLSLDYECA